MLGGVDEIKQYLDARYIGPTEAAWQLFGHPMHQEVPNVQRLALHLLECIMSYMIRQNGCIVLLLGLLSKGEPLLAFLHVVH